MSLDGKRLLVDRENSPFSVVRKCEILDIHRSGIFYFKPRGENLLNLKLMRLISAVDVVERGLRSLTLFGSDLSSGLYIYTLVAGGKVVATKKMVKQ